MTPVYTKDLPDAFFAQLVVICDEIGCKPADMLAVMQNESGIQAAAHNPNGDASGLVQFMPFVLRNLGWLQGHAAFRKLSEVEQLPFVRRYFSPYRGLLTSATAVYVATFLPALVVHASDPDYELVVRGGKLGFAYAPNIGFDRNHDGVITVRELGDAVDRARRSARYAEAAQRASEIMDRGSTPNVADLGPVAADPTADVLPDTLAEIPDPDAA